MQFLELLLGILFGILGQTFLLGLLEGIQRITTGVADGDFGALVNLSALLYQIAATLLGQWRNGQTDYLTVVGGRYSY